MTGVEEDILLLDPNQEIIILQEVPITCKTITHIEVIVNRTEVAANPDPLPGGLELHQGHPVGTNTNA